MTIYNKTYFNKYRGHPVIIINMYKWITVAEGMLLAEFDSLTELRTIFPEGKYEVI